MSVPASITFYDIDGKKRAWSPNTWKTRFLLNYKGLPYKTEYVRFESIELNNKALGLGPSSTSSPYWTLPAIRDAPVGKAPIAIADSVKIADYLEETYPERPLATKALRDAAAPHIQALIQHVFEHMWRIIVPAAVKNFDGPTLDFYNSTRGEIFGEPMDEMCPAEKREERWAVLKAGMDTMAAYIKAGTPGEHSLFSTGPEPVYADFYIAISFVWMERVGPEGGLEEIKTWNDGLWARAYANCERYMQEL